MARGGGRGKPSGPMPRNVLVSKKLSWLLRHGAEKEGLTLLKGGYLNLADVLANRNIKSIGKPSLDEIKALVADNDKQRFTLIHATQLDDAAVQPPTDDTDPKNYYIRANQGHSLKVEEEGLLTALTLESPDLPTTVVHGTRREFWPAILASGGLKKMTRNHIHFATGVPESLKSGHAATAPDSDIQPLPEDDSPAVISGMRLSSTILIFLDLRLALSKGLKFWVSANGVVLSDGNEQGIVGVEFFTRVEERGGRVLIENGIELAQMASKSTSTTTAPYSSRTAGPTGQSKPQLNASDI